ncbi:hypothetical protein [Streptomyces oceani]|uniref:hypothetical protein n=1 Tax=Streptomyces oceani TaxID=1075402 RepID=UPI0008731262|nr:hypothetical protein [Streptomyces oceani]
MSTASVQHSAPAAPVRGATALGAVGDGRSPYRHPRHVFGDALRAIRVFAEATFSVAVLGQYEGVVGQPASQPARQPPDQRSHQRPGQ